MHLYHKIKPAVLLFLAALLLEITLCQASFWGTAAQKGQDMTEQTEFLFHSVSMEEMEFAAAEDMNLSAADEAADITAAYLDEQGYWHIPDGALLLRLPNLNQDVKRLWLDIRIPQGYQVKAEIFAQDEGNAYLYQLGEGSVLLPEVPRNAWMKLYPYGKVKNLYVRLETADRYGNAAAGTMGELICRVDRVIINGRMPFVFRPVRLGVIFGLLCLLYGLREKSRLHEIAFEAAAENYSGQRKRRLAMAGFVLLLLVMTVILIQLNPACRKNLALHHAQYQELAVALSQGKVSVGEAVPELLAADNPYDTIRLQAKQIPYQADYAYHDGKYYVYFGIVPELLLYLPWYLVTGREMQNYQAILVFASGFIVAAAGLIYELMKRYFPKSPFYLWAVGTFMLTGSVAWVYLLVRPDLYHVPIAAAYLFATAGLWLYLAGLNREKGKVFFYGAGSLCLALTAGCRPQFFLFAILTVPLFWKEIFIKRTLFSKKGTVHTVILVLPYLLVAAGLMYYNAVRFGSPFDFGAAYSMTSNDMTHRGFNTERIGYGIWYFLFQPPYLEGNFPYLRSAAIETDYLGKMVSESIFGGVFSISMLTWPVLALFGRGTKKAAGNRNGMAAGRLGESRMETELRWFALLSLAAAVVICAADATGAGILQRYSLDISYGIYLAAAVGLFGLCNWAREKGVYQTFVRWLVVALILHLGFLFLILIQTDGSVNLMTGNPRLFYRIQAALRI